MTRWLLAAIGTVTLGAAAGLTFAPQALPLGAPGPHQPAGKAPDQGYVPDGWPVHTGALLKYSVLIRFGEEPDTMPDGFKFGRAPRSSEAFDREAVLDEEQRRKEHDCRFDQ